MDHLPEGTMDSAVLVGTLRARLEEGPEPLPWLGEEAS